MLKPILEWPRKDLLDLIRGIRANFSEEHCEVACALIPLAPNADRNETRLTQAAYRKGVIVGLSFNTNDREFPDCPYDGGERPNFMSGGNDPRQAWRRGSLDGQRIRKIILDPTSLTIYPTLLQREWRVLSKDLKDTLDGVGATEAGQYVVTDIQREAWGAVEASRC